jgi:hypothetical protein
VLTRRALLGASAAAFAAWPEVPPPPPPRVLHDRDAVLAHVRRVALEGDLLELVERARSWLTYGVGRDLVELLEGRDHARGLRSVRALAEDPEVPAVARRIVERARCDPRVWLAALFATRAAPTTPERLEDVRDRFYDLLGLDIDALRATAAALPQDGLLVVFGVPARPDDVAFTAIREPLRRYLELAHGRRSIEWLASHPDRRVEELVELLVDPSIRVVAFVMHGWWHAVSLEGIAVDPDPFLASFCARLRDDPLGALRAASDPSSLGLGRHEGHLTEADLARRLLGRSFRPKDLVVRYTCGIGRYGPDGAERVAFGTCLVADPTRTRGYAGESWYPDFFADPVPAWPVPPVRRD